MAGRIPSIGIAEPSFLSHESQKKSMGTKKRDHLYEKFERALTKI